MSKGTKQFRLGRVSRLINNMEVYLKALKEMRQRGKDELMEGRIIQLETDIQILKQEFNIED